MFSIRQKYCRINVVKIKVDPVKEKKNATQYTCSAKCELNIELFIPPVFLFLLLSTSATYM